VLNPIRHASPRWSGWGCALRAFLVSRAVEQRRASWDEAERAAESASS
jgi:hypothetical protein